MPNTVAYHPLTMASLFLGHNQHLLANSLQFIHQPGCSMAWNIPLGSSGQLSWSYFLPASWAAADCQSTGNCEVLDLCDLLLSNSQNISVVSTLLSYSTQNTAIGRKLILSQVKPGEWPTKRKAHLITKYSIIQTQFSHLVKSLPPIDIDYKTNKECCDIFKITGYIT